MAHAQRVRAEPLVAGELGALEHVGAEARPLARVLDAEVHLAAVAPANGPYGAIEAWFAPVRAGGVPPYPA